MLAFQLLTQFGQKFLWSPSEEVWSPFLLSFIVSPCCFGNQICGILSNLNFNSDSHGKKRKEVMRRVIAGGSVSSCVTQAFQDTAETDIR